MSERECRCGYILMSKDRSCPNCHASSGFSYPEDERYPDAPEPEEEQEDD